MNKSLFLDKLVDFLELDPSVNQKAWEYLSEFNREFPQGGNDIMAQFERWYFQKVWQEKTDEYYRKKILNYYNLLKLYSEDRELIRWFIEESLKNDSNILTATAISILGKCGDQTDCVYLLKEKEFLKSDDERIRANTVEAVGNICLNNKIYDNDEIKNLLKSLLKDPSNRVTSTAALCLWLMEERIFTDEKNVVTKVLTQKRGNQKQDHSAQELWENYLAMRPDQMIL